MARQKCPMSTDPSNFSNWLVQLFRFTAFLTTPLPDTSILWRQLTEQDPEVDENRAKEGLRRQVGAFGESQLEVQATAARLDVLMTPTVTPNATLDFIPDAAAALAAFNGAIGRWLGGVALSSHRLAFGAVLFLPAEGREEAYDHFGRLVRSVRVDPARAKEVIFRVNRPTHSKVLEGEILNRFTTWGSNTVKFFRGLPGFPGPSATATVEYYFLRLEVDNSTPAERTSPLESAQIRAIYEELAELAVENATRGESDE